MNNVQRLRERVYARDDHRCVYCGSDYRLTVDHVIPKSRGGRDRRIAGEPPQQGSLLREIAREWSAGGFEPLPRAQ